MPLAAPMKFRMSRTLAFVNRMLSGSREAGLSTGSGDICRARSRICCTGGFGRVASIRSRIVCSSSADLRGRLAVRRVVFRCLLVLAQRDVQIAPGFRLTRRVEVHARRVQHRALERHLEFRPVRIRLHGLPIVRDGSVPVVVAARASSPRRKAWPAAHPATTAANATRHTTFGICRVTRISVATSRSTVSSAVRGRRRASSRSTRRRCARSCSGPR